MKAIYWKELLELALVSGPLCMVVLIASFTGDSDKLLVGDSVTLPILAGLLFGAIQGGLDRRRRDDLFLLHRPLARWKLHLSRTLAGMTAVALPILLLCAIWLVRLAYFWFSWQKDQYVVPLTHEVSPPPFVYWPILLWPLGYALGAWSVVRLAVSIRSPRWVIPSLLLLPVLFASLAGRGDGAFSMFGAVFGGVAVFSAASVVTLTEER